MTTKHLSGYYANGYTLSAGYSKLVINKTADVRGDGVDVPSFATVVNLGAVYGYSNGVYLEAGGRLVNGSARDTSASIGGYDAGVVALGAATVANFGTISSGAYGGGVFLDGGSLANGSANDTAALIIGGNRCGVEASGSAAIVNIGTIELSAIYPFGDGVILDAGGSIVNGAEAETRASITGFEIGVQALSAAAIANFGTIGAFGYYSQVGVVLAAGGSITNGSAHDSSAMIYGYRGVRAAGARVTVINYGTIEGFGSVSVDLSGAGGEVVAEMGSTFIGTIEGGDGTLSLAGGGAGTIRGLGHGGTLSGAVDADFIHFDQVVIEAGGAWTLSGSNKIDQTANLIDEGTLINSGALTVSGTLTVAASAVFSLADGDISGAPTGAARIVDDGLVIKNVGTGTIAAGANMIDDGVVEVASGTLDFTGRLFGRGAMKIDVGATLEVDAGAASTLTTSFEAAAATLALKRPNAFAASLSGFAAGDIIDLLAIKATGASVNGGDQLVVVNGARTVARLQLSGNYAGATFATASDGHSGTSVTLTSGGADRPSVAGMASAMASMAAPGGLAILRYDVRAERALVLARPNVHLQ